MDGYGASKEEEMNAFSIENDKFWDTIDSWTNSTIQNAVLCGHAPQHKQMYEECQVYNKWTHSFSKDFPEDFCVGLWTLKTSLLGSGAQHSGPNQPGPKLNNNYFSTGFSGFTSVSEIADRIYLCLPLSDLAAFADLVDLARIYLRWIRI